MARSQPKPRPPPEEVRARRSESPEEASNSADDGSDDPDQEAPIREEKADAEEVRAPPQPAPAQERTVSCYMSYQDALEEAGGDRKALCQVCRVRVYYHRNAALEWTSGMASAVPPLTAAHVAAPETYIYDFRQFMETHRVAERFTVSAFKVALKETKEDVLEAGTRQALADIGRAEEGEPVVRMTVKEWAAKFRQVIQPCGRWVSTTNAVQRLKYHDGEGASDFFARVKRTYQNANFKLRDNDPNDLLHVIHAIPYHLYEDMCTVATMQAAAEKGEAGKPLKRDGFPWTSLEQLQLAFQSALARWKPKNSEGRSAHKRPHPGGGNGQAPGGQHFKKVAREATPAGGAPTGKSTPFPVKSKSFNKAGQPLLAKDQCRSCLQHGHFAATCPKRGVNQEGSSTYSPT